MKKLFLLSLLILFTSGCSNNKYVIEGEFDKEIYLCGKKIYTADYITGEHEDAFDLNGFLNDIEKMCASY